MEGEVGRCRRNHLVPVPWSRTSRQLNALLLAGCEADLAPTDRWPHRDGRRGLGDRAAAAWLRCRPSRSIPTETAAPRVDQKSLVTIRQNRYSVPVALAGLRVSARDRRQGDHDQPRRPSGRAPRAAARQVRHPRRSSITTSSCSRASPAGWSARWRWPRNATAAPGPAAFDELWAALTGRYGARKPPARWSTSLLLCRDHGPDQVALAVRGALAAGAIDGRAVAVLARRAQTGTGSRTAADTDSQPRLAAHRPARRPTSPTTTSCSEAPDDHATQERPDRGAGGADRGARDRAQAPHRPAPLPHLGRRGHRASSRPRPHISAALLEAEMAERAERREKRRLIDARFPHIKRLEDFRFSRQPQRPAATIAALAEGAWIDDRESVIFIGDSGTGKTHARHRARGLRLPPRPPRPVHHPRRARQRTPRGPEPQGARPRRRPLRPHRARRASTSWATSRCPTAPPSSSSKSSPNATSAASLIVTTNLPFGEWTKVFPDARLAKAVVDRLTHRAHIIDTGNESWRFRHGLNARREADPQPDDARARLSPLAPRPTGSAPRRQARGHSNSQHQADSTEHINHAKWGHFKPSRRGQCKPSFSINRPNNRREVEPLQASTVGPLQVSTPRRGFLCPASLLSDRRPGLVGPFWVPLGPRGCGFRPLPRTRRGVVGPSRDRGVTMATRTGVTSRDVARHGEGIARLACRLRRLTISTRARSSARRTSPSGCTSIRDRCAARSRAGSCGPAAPAACGCSRAMRRSGGARGRSFIRTGRVAGADRSRRRRSRGAASSASPVRLPLPERGGAS